MAVHNADLRREGMAKGEKEKNECTASEALPRCPADSNNGFQQIQCLNDGLVERDSNSFVSESGNSPTTPQPYVFEYSKTQSLASNSPQTLPGGGLSTDVDPPSIQVPVSSYDNMQGHGS